jgi:nitrogenase molybdenum-iron protein alpha chain
MLTVEETKKVIDEVLDQYPEKTRKKREKHLAVNEEACSTCSVKSNIKTIPGVMTARGCAYAGSKGVVWGPIKDVVHISHGPVGCGHYSWSGRRNLADGIPGVNNFVPFHFTSDFQERDIVFGGDKKLEKITHEIHELFPLANGISIQSECPVGLIGDDIEAVARKTTEELKIPVVPVRCEGFRGVSQSLGHHIANDAIRDHVLGKKELENKTKYDIALIGDYNIGGDAWETKRLLEEAGLNVRAIWSGDATLEMLQTAPGVKLNVIHCYRSMNYICRHMEETYGIPWVEVNFFGPTKIAESLRKLATYFDENIKEKVEAAIAKNMPAMDKAVQKYKPRLNQKKVMLYVGGLRPRHTIGAFEDLGMEIMGTGYEFGHADDYERTREYIKDGVVVYDDVTAYEFEEFVKKLNPDLVASGIKEKYVFQKMGKPFRQMHSWDYSGPYHGWLGFEIFARDMDMALNSPTWQLVIPKWKKEEVQA